MENNLDNDYKRPNLSNKEYNESSPTKKTLRSNNNQFENSDKKRIRILNCHEPCLLDNQTTHRLPAHIQAVQSNHNRHSIQ